MSLAVDTVTLTQLPSSEPRPLALHLAPGPPHRAILLARHFSCPSSESFPLACSLMVHNGSTEFNMEASLTEHPNGTRSPFTGSRLWYSE